MRIIDKKYINLVRQLTASDFMLRHEGTVLGVVWILLYPLLMLTILYVLFSKRMGKGIDHYEIYLLIGIIQWSFFSIATGSGLKSIIRRRELLCNINLSKTAIVTSSVLIVFISFLLELIILGAFIIISGLGFSIKILYFPFIIFMQLLLITSVAFILSYLNVYFRDAESVWSVLLRMGFFLTPIFYPVPVFTSKAKMILYFLNPMTHLITFSRDIILYKRTPSLICMFTMLLSVVAIFIVSFLFFKRFEGRITERL